MVVLKGDCWHSRIELFIGNPLEPPSFDVERYGNACPYCCDVISEYVMPIVRNRLSQLLVDLFAINPSSELSHAMPVKKLTDSKDIGTCVYACPRIAKSQPARFISVTVLQMIASGLIELNFDEDSNNVKCSVGMIAETPAYLHDEYWTFMYIVDNIVN